MAFFLEAKERLKAADIIANLYVFTDGGAQGRRVLLWQAGLERFIAGLNLTDAPAVLAPSLISKLEPYGYLEERPQYHALGALFSTVIELRETIPEDKKYLAELIVKYALVAAASYLEELRTKYGVTIKQAPEAPQPAPSPARVQVEQPAFDVDEAGLERILHDEDNFLDIEHLASAVLAAQAVCRIEIPSGQPRGTGFLIGPDLLMTNQHVIRRQEDLPSVTARFDCIDDLHGVPRASRPFACDPSFYESSPKEQLDYAVVRLIGKPLEAFVPTQWTEVSPLELLRERHHRGYLALFPRVLTEDERVNIVQHPLGRSMKAVLTQNRVAAITPLRLQYLADTDEGSSGSPVFDRNWGVVALHHSGQPYPNESAGDFAKRFAKGRFKVNEGIPVSAIIKDFEKKNLQSLLPRQ